ncbi:DMT family transporter [Labrys wisconsinensis]|uniref:Drug/metabolite transporter (DMT)-like permease n=1 Tax=Labrys wisconsinensis TaxID=425677 RepID=A0ABU0J846_9HYPH|nr:DMT family transporter [Labrys wisconsinensis]MDQ0470434.1 drug/metabolite transporter (DMT)-like permease [Labrys wisconsinensis]
MSQARAFAAERPSARGGGFAPFDYGLYTLIVLLWGSSWIALHLQLGVVAPEVSLVWRFALAALIMVGWTVLTGQPLRFALGEHLRFAVLGVTLFSSNFLLFYYGGMSTPSGLLAVVFSLAAVFNILLSALFFGERPGARVVTAAVLGFAGVAAMFAPQLLGAAFTAAAWHGLGLGVAGTLSFCLGTMVSVSGQRRGVPVASATTWGMIYGTLFLILLSLLRGQAFIIEPTTRYLGALVWSALFSSVFAFAAYMTLLGRIGADRTGYSTVMYPVVALAISTVAEGYVWTWPAIAGLVLVIVGNLLMLTRPRRGALSAH